MRVKIEISEPFDLVCEVGGVIEIVGDMEYEPRHEQGLVSVAGTVRMGDRRVTRLEISPRYEGESLEYLSEGRSVTVNGFAHLAGGRKAIGFSGAAFPA